MGNKILYYLDYLRVVLTVLVSLSLYLHKVNLSFLLKFLIVGVTGPTIGFVMSYWI